MDPSRAATDGDNTPLPAAVECGDRAVQYVHREAGHAARGLLLRAAALALGAVPVGVFDNGGVQRMFGLPDDHGPLYHIPVGHPAE